MKQVVVQAPAKVNLTLLVTGAAPEGYHLIYSVMQSVALSDAVTVTVAEEKGIRLSCSRSDIPLDSGNTAFKAAEAFFEEVSLSSHGVSIDLVKRVPAGAGLGGSSVDAAGVLAAMNILFETGLSTEELCHIGLRVGADVPFCIRGGTMLAEGIGEILSPLAPLPDCEIVICKPPFSIATSEAFRRFDARPTGAITGADALLQAIGAGDLPAIAREMHNVLEDRERYPVFAVIRERLLGCGALGAVMTGSGSAVFGLFDNDKKARAAAEDMQELGECFLTRPVPHGAMVTARRP